MYYLVTYQKNTGEVFYRARKSVETLKVGDSTSMGWTILDIHEEWNGNFVHPYEIRKFTRMKKYKRPLKKRIVNYLIRKLNKYA